LGSLPPILESMRLAWVNASVFFGFWRMANSNFSRAASTLNAFSNANPSEKKSACCAKASCPGSVIQRRKTIFFTLKINSHNSDIHQLNNIRINNVEPDRYPGISQPRGGWATKTGDFQSLPSNIIILLTLFNRLH